MTIKELLPIFQMLNFLLTHKQKAICCELDKCGFVQ